MEFLTAILGLVPCFYDHTSKHTLYIRHLKKNLQELSKEMDSLNDLYKDVKARVEREEQRQMVRTNQVGGWITEAEGMEKEVRDILQRGDQEIQKRCLGCCFPRNCWSSYKIGKEVSEKLVAVSVLIGRGTNFQVVAETLPRPVVDELPTEETVGTELLYDRACSCLQDPQVGIMGLYGMGGVGKTTLLKKINNSFLSTTSTHFDAVIWVVVSKPFNIEKIQEVIWNKLEIPRSKWETRSSREEKAAEISRVLKTKKYLVLMDDIWERIDLLEIGIPRPDPQNKSKVVFTTRSLDVCHQMKAHKSIEVTCLLSAAAWTLFRKEVGEETFNSHPQISRLAKLVVEECKGLPLALVTLGRAMVGEKDPSNWDKVIQDFTKFPAAISGMEVKLFHRLKVSYDRLSDDVIKSCFLYCSLFPEDWEISCGVLFDLWIGKGFLDEFNDIHEARIQGHKIIQTLRHACLLESCGFKERRVRMHDVIRDMALWLYAECGKAKNKILLCRDISRLEQAQEIPRLEQAQEIPRLKETEKMSLWGENVEKVPEMLVCPNLKTLFVSECSKLKEFSSGFFQFMPSVRVLDLSNNGNLIELPVEIGNLVALRYLNLSCTRIRELPIELLNLKNLVALFLDGMEFLKIIPQELISSLASLKLFTICGTDVVSGVEVHLLNELESLNGISDIAITICTTLSFNKLKSSHKLQRCLTHLVLFNCGGNVISFEPASSILKRMEHLGCLTIDNCNEVKDIKIEVEHEGSTPQSDESLQKSINVAWENHFGSLRRVVINDCSQLLNLTWLVYAPFLEHLYVLNCESIEQVICNGVEESLDIFIRLKYLLLNGLPRLKSIYNHPLLFPSLEVIKVYDCKSLKSLPFHSNASKSNLKKIKGEESWWNQLEWNDEVIKYSISKCTVVQAYLEDSGEPKTSGINDLPGQWISN